MINTKELKLSSFLADCRDNQDTIVGVRESQIRAYAQTCERALKRIKELDTRVNTLEHLCTVKDKGNAKLSFEVARLQLALAPQDDITLEVLDLWV